MNEKSNITELSEAIRSKLRLRKEVRELTENDEWTVPQLVLQEIQAEDEVLESVSGTSATLIDQIERMKKRIETDFNEEPEVRDLIMQSIPGYSSILRWTKTDTWKEAVMSRIRNHKVFSNINRTKVLDNIFKVATSGGAVSIKAAELYFKLEGTLNPSKENKGEVDDVYDRFKDLQKTLHSKK